MPTDPNIRDDERTDDSGSSMLARVDVVLRILQRDNARLTSIRDNFIPPPEPDKPAISQTLLSISAEADTTKALVADIQRKLGGV